MLLNQKLKINRYLIFAFLFLIWYIIKMKYFIYWMLAFVAACGDGTHPFSIGLKNNQPLEIAITQDAFAEFNKHIGCNIAPLTIVDDSIFTVHTDFEHQIDFVTKPQCEHDCLGVTYVTAFSDIEIQEMLNIDDLAIEGWHTLFVVVIVHELGHVFGLDHSKNPDDIMYEYAYADSLNDASWDRFKKQILTRNPNLCKNIK